MEHRPVDRLWTGGPGMAVRARHARAVAGRWTWPGCSALASGLICGWSHGPGNRTCVTDRKYTTLFRSLAWLYARGTRALWQVAGRGRGVQPWQAASFAAGVMAVAIALVSQIGRATV